MAEHFLNGNSRDLFSLLEYINHAKMNWYSAEEIDKMFNKFKGKLFNSRNMYF
jgi:hypothetical protein